jgi:hypothetical protein
MTTKAITPDLKIPALLLALSIVPVLGGVARLGSLSAGASAAADDARFFAAPVPLLIHVIAATIYALLGAFQFSNGIRLRWPRWHRRAGALLFGCGFLTGVTGIWMTAFYQIPHNLQGPLLYGVRLLVGLALLSSLVQGLASIPRRDLAQHEAWMIRAYALAQGAGTQALIFLPVTLVSGPVLGLPRDILLSAAWLLNLGIAEALLRRRARVARPARARRSMVPV